MKLGDKFKSNRNNTVYTVIKIDHREKTCTVQWDGDHSARTSIANMEENYEKVNKSPYTKHKQKLKV